MSDAITLDTGVRTLLREVQPFARMTPRSIRQLLATARTRTLSAGETVILEGDVSDAVFVILDGEVEIARKIGARDLPIAVRSTGTVVGEMGVVTGQFRNATVRARGPVTVLRIDGNAFMDALKESPEAMVDVLTDVAGRLQAAEVDLVHNQKMASLGVLAAGLAHELNNPASALERGTLQLRDAVLAWNAAAERLSTDAEMIPDLEAERSELLNAETDPGWLDPLERSDREQQIQAWLQRAGIPEPWKIASPLVDRGLSIADLDRMAERLPGETVGRFIPWLAAGLQVQQLLRTLVISANAISEIVTAVKAYTRLDQAPIQTVDLHESIDQALTILRSKLRTIRVNRRYADQVPELTAYAGELNQAWTNLIDNAADAMEGAGELTIATDVDGPDIVISFIDSGPGIPDDIQKHLFDPFFTTKPPGQGTGLGLAITHSIIRRHGGTIRVSSEPGGTMFTVRLPATGITEHATERGQMGNGEESR